MYLECLGSGSPTVILEAGLYGWSPTWTSVLPDVATFTRVCSYDRAGLGLSDPGPRPRTAKDANRDLERLLDRAGIAAPFVLVGHSAGGMYQRLFTASHRDRVVGLVLIDSNAPTDEQDRASVDDGSDERRAERVLTVLTYTGIFRFVAQVLKSELGDHDSARYPEEARVRMRGQIKTLARSMNDEWMLFQSAYRATSNESLGDLPITVIAALGYRPDDADRADWLARQTQVANLSTRGHLIVLDHESHPLPLIRPEIVTRAIREVVDEARAQPRSVGSPRVDHSL